MVACMIPTSPSFASHGLRCVVLFGLVALLLTAPGALAQTPGAPSEARAAGESSKAVETSPPISVPEIPARSELLQRVLTRILSQVAPDPGVAEIGGDLAALRERNRAREVETRSRLAEHPSLDQLADLDRDWSQRMHRLTDWRATLGRRASELEAAVNEIGELRKLWRAALENSRASDAPREILANVEANLAAIERTREVVTQRRAAVLSLLTDVSKEEMASTAIRYQISTARAELLARILEPDGAPLWSAGKHTGYGRDRDRFRRAMDDEWRAFLEFTERERGTFWPIAVVFGAILWLGIHLRRLMRRRANSDHLAGSISIVERPYSVAILTTYLVYITIFPYTPNLVRYAAGIALILPLVRLVSPLIPIERRATLWLLFGLYLVDRLRDFLVGAVVMERLVFFAETLTASGFLLFVIYRKWRVGPSGGRETRTDWTGADLGVQIACALLGLSTLGNLIGYAGFAKLVGEGTLQAMYLVMLAYAAYRVGMTFLLVLITSERLRTFAVLRNHQEPILHWCRVGLIVILGANWGLLSLDGFAIREPVTSWLYELLSTSREIGAVSISILDLIIFPLTIFLAFTISRAIRAVLQDDVYPRVRLKRGVPNAISTTVQYVLLLGGFLLALGAAGIDLSRFSLLAGAFGVGIGFGLQNVVNNFVSGLILLYERPIQVGDVIELGDLLGRVKRIGIRASTIVTYQGADVIVPNGNLLSEQLINWTLSNKFRRIELPVGVAYGNRPDRVIQVLEAVLEESDWHPGAPASAVLFRGFGDSSLDFEVRFWALDIDYLEVRSRIASRIYDALEVAGIEIPFPQRDLHLRSVDPEASARLRGTPTRGEAS
jgi:small-conductance mechanosensitive channel